MDHITFLILVSFILIASLYIGKQSSNAIRNQQDYFLSGRKLSLFKVAMTILATQLGGGVIIGAAEAAYKYGWAAISYSLGISVGLIILSLGIGAKFRAMEISTVPEIFDKVYNSKCLRIFASVLYIVSMLLILIALGVSARKFSLTIGFHPNLTFIIFWLITIAYTTSGGLSAVTQTDILQIIFILLAFGLTFLFLLLSDTHEVINIPTIQQEIPWLNWILFPCLFVIIGQDMAQRCFAAESSKAISKSTLIASILLVISSILPVYLGVIAYKIGFTPNGDSSILLGIVNKLTNPYITSVFAAAILMAILSTADSLICVISSNIALDIIPRATSSIKMTKIITTAIGLAAMLLSFVADDIIPIMITAYELSICGLFIPVIMAIIYKKSPSVIAAYVSSFIGIVTYLFAYSLINTEYKALFALIVSCFTFIFIDLFSRSKLSSYNNHIKL